MVIKYNFNIFYGESVHKGKEALGPQKSYYDPVYSEWIFWSRRRGDRSLSLAAPSKIVGLALCSWLWVEWLLSILKCVVSGRTDLDKIMKKIIWGSPVPFFPSLPLSTHPLPKDRLRHITNLQLQQKINFNQTAPKQK